VFPKLCFADPKRSATTSQGTRKSISVMATNLKFDILLKIIAELLQLAVMFISYDKIYVFKKPLCRRS